ncbi:MAG: hypothetical protein U0132_16820 [Gemmatimonadaceae bacterium]
MRKTATIVLVCIGSGCTGGDSGAGPGGGGPPPVTGAVVPALEDAAERLVGGLPAVCLSGVSSALTALRAKMSPTRTATAADVSAVRTALSGCTDDASAADRDAIRLALDVADDVIAGR